VVSPKFTPPQHPYIYTFELNGEVDINEENRLKIMDDKYWVVPDAGAYSLHINIELDDYDDVTFQQVQLVFKGGVITSSNNPMELHSKYWDVHKNLHLNTTKSFNTADKVRVRFLYKSSLSHSLKNSTLCITRL